MHSSETRERARFSALIGWLFRRGEELPGIIYVHARPNRAAESKQLHCRTSNWFFFSCELQCSPLSQPVCWFQCRHELKWLRKQGQVAKVYTTVSCDCTFKSDFLEICLIIFIINNISLIFFSRGIIVIVLILFLSTLKTRCIDWNGKILRLQK